MRIGSGLPHLGAGGEEMGCPQRASIGHASDSEDYPWLGLCVWIALGDYLADVEGWIWDTRVQELIALCR